MGPRSEGARKAAALLMRSRRAVTLQWGRARRERGKRCLPDPHASTTPGFNGAALGGSAESYSMAWETEAEACFNGAALGGSAESAPTWRRMAMCILLQWGRARRERGKPRALFRPRPGSLSFNGAALGGSAESYAAPVPRAVIRDASMGPRSEGARKDPTYWYGLLHLIQLQWGRARRERGKG